MKKCNRVWIVRPTPEEEADIVAQLAEDLDIYEWTDEDWDNVKFTHELFPDLAEWGKKRKTVLEAGLLDHVAITLDRDTTGWFKAMLSSAHELQ